MECPYNPFNFCKVGTDVSSFIPDSGNLWLHFFLVSQPQHNDIWAQFLFWRGLSCIVESLSASLASNHQIPIALTNGHIHQGITIKNFSRYWKMFSEEKNHSWFRTTGLDEVVILLIFSKNQLLFSLILSILLFFISLMSILIFNFQPSSCFGLIHPFSPLVS